VLVREESQLRSRSFDELDDTVRRKETLMQTDKQHGESLTQLLGEAQLAADAAGLEALLKQTNCGQPWGEVATSLQQCAHQNAINGELVFVGRGLNQSLLGLLYGASHDRTYSAGGRVNPAFRAQPIASI
jgi:flagellar biosynthesis/type III secretory pathway chaperone